LYKITRRFNINELIWMFELINNVIFIHFAMNKTEAHSTRVATAIAMHKYVLMVLLYLDAETAIGSTQHCLSDNFICIINNTK